ncbi:hypothetical protein [Micromonospora sp. RP3T]|uniref:hypothetical protein n=1 Tax=Micromonospora sp. RP3T TaxID=2135446 RepID=UPI003D72BF1C
MDTGARPDITATITRGITVNEQPTTSRTIEVDADVYDILERTASSRGTDINGAVRYLTEAPAPRTTEDED